MIPTDLEAEWQRVATSDNYLVFDEQHGGAAKIAADPTLRAAYERRRHIADTFLAMIREAYAKRHRRPPFEDRTKLEAALDSAAHRSRPRGRGEGDFRPCVDAECGRRAAMAPLAGSRRTRDDF